MLLPEAEEETLAAILTYEKYVASGVGGKPTIQVSGANLQVVNGEGKTASANGEGNLVIGYDENPGTKRGKPGLQTGSHDLILGEEQEFTTYGGILAGYWNTITGPFASVTGGASNSATGQWASISGGGGNTASGQTSSVSGGNINTASGELSSAGGGFDDSPSGSRCGPAGVFSTPRQGHGRPSSAVKKTKPPPKTPW